jgi:protease-4
MSPAAVLEVAEGRVWSGIQAKDRGLVDQTGTLQEAIDAAARIAGLGSDYHAVFQERELTPFESFLIEITGSAMAHFGAGSGFGFGRAGLPALPGTLLEDIARDLAVLARGSDGCLAVVAHCLCDVD